MKIGENINSLLNVYAQRAEEKYGSKTEMTAKAAEAERAGEVSEAAESPNAQASENRDRYVPAAEDEPIGLYELYSDEEGVMAIKFDDPEANGEKNADSKKSADESNKSSDSKAAEDGNKADGGEDKKAKSENCTGNTDKVDREIERLKKKAEQLEMQLRSAEGDKQEEISRKLEQVQSELARKDNDTYRRAHTVFT